MCSDFLSQLNFELLNILPNDGFLIFNSVFKCDLYISKIRDAGLIWKIAGNNSVAKFNATLIYYDSTTN